VTEPRGAATEATTDAVRLAVDAMGGDFGPSEVVPGALDFARSHPQDSVILVGDEAIALAEPIAPLCEPDCPGLCPECGIRMTPGHEHPDDDIDPRLEALRAFKVDAPDETG
jgi:hypothetical protein